MVGALLGPNIASLTKDIISTSTYSGSYLFLSFLTIIPIIFFIFYTNEKLNNEYIEKNKITRNYSELLFQPKFTQAVVGAAIGYATMSFLMTATPISMHIFDGMSINKTGFVIQAHILSMFLHSLFTAQGLNDFSVFTTQATGALLAGFILNLYGWKITNILCIPLLIIVIFVVYRSDKLSKEYK